MLARQDILPALDLDSERPELCSIATGFTHCAQPYLVCLIPGHVAGILQVDCRNIVGAGDHALVLQTEGIERCTGYPGWRRALKDPARIFNEALPEGRIGWHRRCRSGGNDSGKDKAQAETAHHRFHTR